MRKLLTIIVLMLSLAASTFAVEVEIDGLWYDLVSKAKVATVLRYKNSAYYSGVIVIPENVVHEGNTYSVTSIGDKAFYNCSGLTSVTIPNSVTSIGYFAFCECKKLTSVTIPNSVTSIGNYAFDSCSGLTSVTIGSGVTNIGISAFRYCSGLTSVTIPNSVTSIGDYAFFECEKLTSVTIPNSVTSIGDYAFCECEKLTSVTIPNSVTSIGNYAFSYCSGLTSVTIGSGVTSIGGIAFSGCYGLTSVTIPNSVTSIGNYAFSRCSGLTSITIPNSVTSIGGYAFMNCSGLTSVTIGSGVTSIGYDTFYGCSGLTSVTIPNSVTSIEDRAFEGCSGLTSITIPNSVTSIGEGAFVGCSGLTSVTIGSGVTSIGSHAFDGVDIPTVISLIENPFTITGKTSNNRTFSQNTFINATLYVPKGTIEKYKATEGWKDFVFIEEGTGSGDTPTTPKCEKPTISYENGKLSFTSETEGAEFISEITDADIKTYYDSWIQLSAAYNISVYATKSGYDNSDVVTATLYFTSASLNDPSGISSAKASAPVLIQTLGNTLHVTGVEDGTEVVVFGLDGSYIGHSKSFGGTVNIELNGANQIVIVKVGNESVKVKI
jgi:hypothetical protein